MLSCLLSCFWLPYSNPSIQVSCIVASSVSVLPATAQWRCPSLFVYSEGPGRLMKKTGGGFENLYEVNITLKNRTTPITHLRKVHSANPPCSTHRTMASVVFFDLQMWGFLQSHALQQCFLRIYFYFYFWSFSSPVMCLIVIYPAIKL